MRQKMKIYVTGVAGMLGYGIYRTLHSRAEITGMDLLDIKIPGLSYRVLSLFDTDAVEKSIVEAGPDVLIHTAAYVNVDGCEQEPEYARRLNTQVTEHLADICGRHGIKMAYISTDAVFDGTDPKLYTEDDPVNPINVYGRTKLDGETAVLRYPGNLVFRTNIYGLNIQKKRSFGEWVYCSLKQGETLNMFTDIDFSPILVDELAELLYEACAKELDGRFHACGTGCITKYDFGIKLKEIFQIESGEIRRAVSSDAGLKAKRSKHMGMSNEKLTSALQIPVSTPQESIEKFYQLCKREAFL